MAKSRSYGGLILLLLALAAAGGGAWYYLRGKQEKQPEIQTVQVSRGDVTQVVTATGDLQPVTVVDIGAQVSGQIKDVLVDFNSRVKAGDVLARIDESTPTQRLKQAQADYQSALASNKLIRVNVQRTRDLFEKNLVSQQELDSAEAQLAQSTANLVQREAAVANAKLDLERTVITAPIDGMVLERKTDKGRTVNASMNAPSLFTLVSDLKKMQINAAVAEADIGSIHEGQPVRFTVDAFPNRAFSGTVRQVRNAATSNQNVVTYATIIDVDNEELKLKPGMTANVSIVVQERSNVLRVPNSTLRVRIPQDLLPAAPPPAAPGSTTAAAGKQKGNGSNNAAATAPLGEEESRRAMFEIVRAIGVQRGSAPTPAQIEQAKTLAKTKGLDPEAIADRLSNLGRGPGGGGPRRGFGGERGGAGGDRSGDTIVTQRTLYRLRTDGGAKHIEPVAVRLGITDGIFTEVLGGLSEDDTLVTGVTAPGAAAVPAAQARSGGMQNPFQGGSRFGRGR